MEVTDLQGYSGMAFVYDEDVAERLLHAQHPTPLSIAWIAADGAVVTIADMAPCEDRDGCPTYAPDGPYRYAIEVFQGDLATSASPRRPRSPSAAAARRHDASDRGAGRARCHTPSVGSSMCAGTPATATIARSIDALPPPWGPRLGRVHREDVAPMRAYELMVIFESGLDDQAIDDQVKSVAAQIATRGGTVASTDRWGRRRFAYEIDHKTRATTSSGSSPPTAATSRPSSGPCASRTRSSATSSSACPTGRPLVAACSATARPNRLRPGRRVHEHGRQHRHRHRQRHPRPRAALHALGAGHRHLRPGRQPPLAEPPDPGVGGAGLVLRRHLLGAARPERGRHPRRRAAAPSSPAASSSARGRPTRATSAPRSRSSPTRSAPACAGPPPTSPATSARRPATAPPVAEAAAPVPSRTPAPAGYDPAEEPF